MTVVLCRESFVPHIPAHLTRCPLQLWIWWSWSGVAWRRSWAPAPFAGPVCGSPPSGKKRTIRWKLWKELKAPALLPREERGGWAWRGWWWQGWEGGRWRFVKSLVRVFTKLYGGGCFKETRLKSNRNFWFSHRARFLLGNSQDAPSFLLLPVLRDCFPLGGNKYLPFKYIFIPIFQKLSSLMQYF